MLTVKDIQVLNNLSMDYLVVKFEIEDTLESLSDYNFNIYRSVFPEDGWEKIATGITEFQYQDGNVNLYKIDVKYYYKIEIVNTVSSETLMSDIVGSLIYPSPDCIAGAINYMNAVYLDVISNPSIWILLKRRFGTRCTNCWDDIRKQQSKDDCPVCFETGYIGGYSLPIKTSMSYYSPTPAEQNYINTTEEGIAEDPLQIWIPNYPIVSPDDIIIDDNNIRYSVMRVQKTTKNGRFVLRQILTIQRLPPGDIIYKIPVSKE